MAGVGGQHVTKVTTSCDLGVALVDLLMTTTPVVGIPTIPFVAVKDKIFRSYHASSSVKTLLTAEELQARNVNDKNALELRYSWFRLCKEGGHRRLLVHEFPGQSEQTKTASYIPVADDVGKTLQLVCSLRFKSTGDKEHVVYHSCSCSTAPVISAPKLLQRVPFPVLDFGALKRQTPLFTVLTYNLLTEHFVSPLSHPNCPSWALGRAYRKRRQLDELRKHSPDIMLLQEVTQWDYENIFSPSLQAVGYMGNFRTRETRINNQWQDGCATFFKSAEYKVLHYQFVSLNESFRDVLNRYGYRISSSRLKYPGPIAQITFLETKDKPIQYQLLVINTHLPSSSNIEDLKLLSIIGLYERILQLSGQFPGYNFHTIPIIFGGDFNGTTDSPVHDLIRTGKIDFESKFMMKYIHTFQGMPNLRINYPEMQMRSAVADTNPPQFFDLPFTSLSVSNAQTLDFIFYRGESLTPIASFKCDLQALHSSINRFSKTSVSKKVVAFPNQFSSSDHDMTIVLFTIDPTAYENIGSRRQLYNVSPFAVPKYEELSYRQAASYISHRMEYTSTHNHSLSFGEALKYLNDLGFFKDSNPSSITSVASIFTAIFFSRLHYEHGLTVKAPPTQEAKQERQKISFIIKTALVNIIKKKLYLKPTSKEQNMFLCALIGNANYQDLDCATYHFQRESFTGNLIRTIDTLVSTMPNSLASGPWIHFSQTCSIRRSKDKLEVIKFPRCCESKCLISDWHHDPRSELTKTRQEQVLGSVLENYFQYCGETFGSFHDILLMVFGYQQPGTESSTYFFHPYRATVEMITSFLYNKLIDLLAKITLPHSISGFVMYDGTGWSDCVHKETYESYRKVWLANQIKWYWCLRRYEPADLFQRILRLYPSCCISELTTEQEEDIQETMRRYFIMPLRWSTPGQKIRHVEKYQGHILELPCFGVMRPQEEFMSRSIGKRKLPSIENNELTLSAEINDCAHSFMN